MPAARPDPARRLLIRPGAIGDCIVSLPALESLRAPYTEIWTARPNVPLIQFADRVRAIPDTDLDLLEIPGREPPPALLEDLRQFDSIISWYGANRPEFSDRAVALGLPFHFCPALPPNGDTHAVDFYLAQARTLGGRSVAAVPRILIDVPRRDFAAIHPFSGSPKKNWPLSSFQQLAATLDLPVEWTAGPDEPLPGARRFDNLDDLARWLASARLYIGNDSGVTHLAAAVGTPVLAIFLTSNPAVWAPRGHQVTVLQPTL